MSLAFALKILTDLCYFMFAISSVVTRWEHSGMLMTSPVFVTLAAYFSALLAERLKKRRWLRFIPLALCAGAFFFVETAVDWIVTIPMAGYLVFIVIRDSVTVNYEETLSRFLLCLKILPAVAVITIVASNKDGFMEVMLPYFFLFLILSVMLLRMLRHSDQVFQDQKFRVMNLVEIAAVCGFGYLLSTGYIVACFKWVGNMLMIYVLRPLFMGILYLLGGVAWVFRKIFGGIDLSIDEADLAQLEQSAGEGMDPGDMAVMEYYAEEAAKADTQWLNYAAMALGAIVLIVLAVVLFRILMNAGRRVATNKFGDVRESVDESPRDAKLTRSPRDRVRNYYRRFLRMCVKEGLNPDLNLNSLQVNQSMEKVFTAPGMYGLREVYIQARYSSADISDEDVKKARQMLDQIKKAEKAEEKRRAKVDRSTGA